MIRNNCVLGTQTGGSKLGWVQTYKQARQQTKVYRPMTTKLQVIGNKIA